MQRVILLTTVFSLAFARERWVWGQQQQQERSGRQIDPSLFSPQVGGGGFSLQSSSSAASLSPLSRPSGGSESSFSLAETRALRGSLSQSQPPLVIRPLPIDISTLPLETQDSKDAFDPLSGFLSTSSRQRPSQDLGGGEGLLASPGQQVPVVDLSRSHLSRPSLSQLSRAQKAGHLEALVSTPDISKLPLQSEADSFSSSSSSFSPSTPLSSSSFAPSFSSYSFVSPFAPGNDVQEGNSGVLFPQRIGDAGNRLLTQAASAKNPTPPRATPLPTRVFLPPLDNTNFLKGDTVKEKQAFKALEAIQKEALTQNSKKFDLAFQSLSERLNDIQVDENSPVIFPVLTRRIPVFAGKTPAGLGQGSQFSASGKSALVTLPNPLLLPAGLREESSSFLADQELKPLKRTPRAGRKLDRRDGNEEGIRRGLPSYVWVWPDDTPAGVTFVN